MLHSQWACYIHNGHVTFTMGTLHSKWARYIPSGHVTFQMGTLHSKWARYIPSGHVTFQMGTLVLVLFTWRNTLSIQNTGGAITISMQTVCYNYLRCTGVLFRIVVDWAGSFRLADAIVARGNGSIRRRLVAAWALALRWLISRRFDA